MYERVMEEMEGTRAAIEKTGKLFMYAEDWIYAPAVTKTAEILKATKDKILFMKGEESHSGSHAAHAAQWAMTGGGSLIRMGCHPLSAVLYLKQVEAKARGETISVASVTCDVGNVAACLQPDERAVIKANPVDVEDWGTLTATFSDGTKATMFSGDMIVGGVRNLIETYTSGGALFANITPNTHMMSYQTSEEKLAGVYITEKVDRKTGWQYVCLEEEWTRGYLQEIQDFMECVATGRQPLVGSRAGLRDDQGQLRRLLGRRRGAARDAVRWCRRHSPGEWRAHAPLVLTARIGSCAMKTSSSRTAAPPASREG